MKKIYLYLLLFIAVCPVVQAQEPILGEVRIFAGNFAPIGWAFCDGQLLAIHSNTALFSLLGTTYGGDGRTTFALPDLRGRAAIHPGTGPGLSTIRLGQKTGSESNVITSNQLPAHTHQMSGVSEAGSVSLPTGAYPAGTQRLDPEYSQSGTKVLMNTDVIGVNQTTSQPVNNRQPSIAIRYIIALQGIYPSRT